MVLVLASGGLVSSVRGFGVSVGGLVSSGGGFGLLRRFSSRPLRLWCVFLVAFVVSFGGFGRSSAAAVSSAGGSGVVRWMVRYRPMVDVVVWIYWAWNQCLAVPGSTGHPSCLEGVCVCVCVCMFGSPLMCRILSSVAALWFFIQSVCV